MVTEVACAMRTTGHGFVRTAHATIYVVVYGSRLLQGSAGQCMQTFSVV